MDTSYQLRDPNISTLIQGMKLHSNLIKFTQLFISISVFSFIFSPSSLFVFLHYFKFYFSTLPFQLYTHNIDKNSMFLLCNGLLVFVGLSKSFSSSSSDSEEEDCPQSRVLDVVVNGPVLEREAEKRTSEPDKQSAEEEEEEKVEDESFEKMIMIDEEQGEEMKEEEEEEEVSEVDYVLIEENIIEEEDYVEEEESGMLSTEELNKKFEDFIRKMKEDLRIDARRHLVMV